MAKTSKTALSDNQILRFLSILPDSQYDYYINKYLKSFQQFLGANPKSLSIDQIRALLSQNLNNQFVDQLLQKEIKRQINDVIQQMKQQQMISRENQLLLIASCAKQSYFIHDIRLLFELLGFEYVDADVELVSQWVAQDAIPDPADPTFSQLDQILMFQSEAEELQNQLEIFQDKLDQNEAMFEKKLLEKEKVIRDLENDKRELLKKSRIDESEHSSLQAAYDSLQKKYKDMEELYSEWDDPEEYESNMKLDYLSAFKVSAIPNGKTRFIRIADIDSNGILMSFKSDPKRPDTFENRSHFIWNESLGIHPDLLYTVCSWGVEPNHKSQDKDFYTLSRDYRLDLIPIIRIPETSSIRDVIKSLKNGIHPIPDRYRYLFLPASSANDQYVEVLRIMKSDLIRENGSKTVKLNPAARSSYPVYHIQPTHIIHLDEDYYFGIYLGAPAFITPANEVTEEADRLVSYCLEKSLRKNDTLTRREYQLLRDTLAELDLGTMIDQLTKSFYITSEEANLILSKTVDEKSKKLNVESVNNMCFFRAIQNNPELLNLSMDLLREEWTQHNHAEVADAQMKVDQLHEEIRKSENTLESMMQQQELMILELEESKKQKVSELQEVENQKTNVEKELEEKRRALDSLLLEANQEIAEVKSNFLGVVLESYRSTEIQRILQLLNSQSPIDSRDTLSEFLPLQSNAFTQNHMLNGSISNKQLPGSAAVSVPSVTQESSQHYQNDYQNPPKTTIGIQGCASYGSNFSYLNFPVLTDGCSKAANDIEDLEDWNDFIDCLKENLQTAGIDQRYSLSFASIVAAAYINHIPLLLAGPGTIEISNAVSCTINGYSAAKMNGEMVHHEEFVSHIQNLSSKVLVIENPLSHTWVPQIYHLARSCDQTLFIISFPFAEDIHLEPKSLMGYVFPVFTDFFITSLPAEDFDGCLLNVVDPPLPSSKQRNPLHSLYSEIGMTPITRHIADRIYATASSLIKEFPDEQKLLFHLIPYAYTNMQEQRLSNVLQRGNNKFSLSSTFIKETRRWLGLE